MYFQNTSWLTMKKTNRIVDVLNRVEEVVLVAMFSAMVLIIFVQVIMRKTGNSLYWSCLLYTSTTPPSCARMNC